RASGAEVQARECQLPAWILALSALPTGLRPLVSWFAFAALAYPEYAMPRESVKAKEIESSPLPDGFTFDFQHSTLDRALHSTVTDFARFLGWSTSEPRSTPT